MECDKCDNEATVIVTIISTYSPLGVERLNLCDACERFAFDRSRLEEEGNDAKRVA